VIAAPPFEAGATQETTDWVFAFEVAAGLVGAPGVVLGVATFDAVLWLPVPAWFVATIRNV
jgi:hypothetical protein